MSAAESLGDQFGVESPPPKKVKHTLQCDEENLPAGVKKERNWSCAGCGQKYFGFDNYVRKAHTEHRKSLQA